MDIQFDYNAGQCVSWDDPEGDDPETSFYQAQPLVFDQWVPLEVCIDLDNDIYTFDYNNVRVIEREWQNGAGGSGLPQLDIDCIDLYGNGASAMFYDNIRLVRGKKHKATNGTVAGFGVQNDYTAACGFDDVRWCAHGSTLFYQISVPVVVYSMTFNTTMVPTTAIELDVEASKANNNGNLFPRAKMLNVTTGQFEAFQGTTPLTTNDQINTYPYTGNSPLSDFVGPNGDVQVKIEIIQNSGLANTRSCLDDVFLRIK